MVLGVLRKRVLSKARAYLVNARQEPEYLPLPKLRQELEENELHSNRLSRYGDQTSQKIKDQISSRGQCLSQALGLWKIEFGVS